MKTVSTYQVVRGDTLFAIAKKFNMTVADVKSLNGLKDNNLKIGQTLKVWVTQSTPITNPASTICFTRALIRGFSSYAGHSNPPSTQSVRPPPSARSHCD